MALFDQLSAAIKTLREHAPTKQEVAAMIAAAPSTEGVANG